MADPKVVAPPLVAGGLYRSVDPETKQDIQFVMVTVVQDPGKVARGYAFIPELGGTISFDAGSHRMARLALIAKPWPGTKTAKPVYGTFYAGPQPKE